MDRDRALELLRGGLEGVALWNRSVHDGETLPNLSRADLTGADLREAVLNEAVLREAMLRGAVLYGADLREAVLHRADLREAVLSGAVLYGADLREAVLYGADLRGADLREAVLHEADLRKAMIHGTIFGRTVFSDLDLAEILGLDAANHISPSSVSIDTLARSQGKTPKAFLRNCGLAPWEVLAAGLYDPALTPPQVVELQYQIFDAWTKGRSMINGCFLSYSQRDAKFADKLRDRLVGEGVNVWLDRHDLVAGPLQNQVWRAIQVHHVVVLVLSEDSVKSDWVENELDMVRRKEKAEGRAVLCPVALDESWKAKVDAGDGPGDPSRALWRTLTQKLVVDFSPWKTKGFEEAFGKLLRGLKVNYGPGDAPDA